MAEDVNHLAVHVKEKSVDSINCDTRVNGGNVRKGEGRIQFLNFRCTGEGTRRFGCAPKTVPIFVCWIFDNLKLECRRVGYVVCHQLRWVSATYN